MRSKMASSRAFGLLIAVVLALIGGLYYWPRREGYTGWLIAAALLLVVSLLMPRLLAPLKRFWRKLGMLLHHIISPVILGLLYVFSIVSVGLLVRLFGQDLLSLRRNAAARSYWIRRDDRGPAPDSMKNQF
jgi:hypothetical protein